MTKELLLLTIVNCLTQCSTHAVVAALLSLAQHCQQLGETDCSCYVGYTARELLKVMKALPARTTTEHICNPCYKNYTRDQRTSQLISVILQSVY